MAAKSSRAAAPGASNNQKPAIENATRKTATKASKSTSVTSNKTTSNKAAGIKQLQHDTKTKDEEERRKKTITQAVTMKNKTKSTAIEATTIKNTKPSKTTSTSKILTVKPQKTTTKSMAPSTKRTTMQPTPSPTQSLRAKQSSNYKQTSAAPVAAPPKPNAVLDTYHNVTVASPPQKRRDKELKGQVKAEENANANASVKEEKRSRTLTHTLQPEEVIVLKRDSAKQHSAAEIESTNRDKKEDQDERTVKEPIAFEVKFDDELESERKVKGRPDEEDLYETVDNYSDDFESYESDFEETAESSSQEDQDSKEEEQSSSSKVEDGMRIDEQQVIKQVEENADDDGDEDDSELTQNPITVIQRDKELERKLDSGLYDMHGQRRQPRLADLSAQSTQQQFDSLDTNTNSEQLDSGISSYGNGVIPAHFKMPIEMQPPRDCDSFYGGYTQFYSKPSVSKRSLELMQKLHFDCLTFELFDLKPLSYDVYMQSYGRLNTCQMSVQTQDQQLTSECQTDDIEYRCIWTQHPPLYDLKTVQQQLDNGGILQNCYGEEDVTDTIAANTVLDACTLSLAQLSLLRQAECKRSIKRQMWENVSKQVDLEGLNRFLHRAEFQMSLVLNQNLGQLPGSTTAKRKVGASALQSAGVSQGYNALEADFLNALRVRRVFGNARHQFIITVHECLPGQDVYREDFANLLIVWSTTSYSKPLRLLSTWEEVCHAEICNESADIIVCGLRDGSVAMWDLRETYTYCSKLDGQLAHFAATQSTVPTLPAGEGAAKSTELLDLGAVVDVRSFRPTKNPLANSFKNIQFAALNDSGILTVWALIENSSAGEPQPDLPLKQLKPPQVAGSKFEYSSPWARVKLIQSAICNLRSYLEKRLLKSQSQFDKTKSLFQQNIYNDELLRELNETQTVANALQGQGLQGLRFTSIDAGCERVYVCTNRNFILACTKSLNPTRFARIAINETRFLFPTALRVLSNENYLAVGLSNGSVMIVNCNQQKTLLSKTNMVPSAPAPTLSAREFELDTGKSCAIQNIILNERRAAGGTEYGGFDESRPTTAACIDMIHNPKRSFELRVYDQQLLLSGTALRKDLVQSLVLSSDGWRLFALADGAVRVYDFYTDRELCVEAAAERVEDIAVTSISSTAQHLVLLCKEKNTVQLHRLSN